MWITLQSSLTKLNIIATISIFYLFINMKVVNGHGRLIDPPSRSSAWRFGFKTPINYNDNELFCGGFNVQWNINGGKCGVCGDPYNGRKDNELPNGKYAQNLVITRTYNEASIIDVKVSLTANHKGFFVFKLCPTADYDTEVTQECLDQFPLTIINSRDPNKYIVLSNRAETFSIKAKLPNGLTCNRCVFQWTYTSGNNWGKCEDGKTFRVGCGPQETFRGCADVRIFSRYFTTNDNETEKATLPSEPISNAGNCNDSNCSKTRPSLRPILKPNDSEIENIKICKSDGLWRGVPNMDEWCRTNCAVGHCPASHCICS